MSRNQTNKNPFYIYRLRSHDITRFLTAHTVNLMWWAAKNSMLVTVKMLIFSTEIMVNISVAPGSMYMEQKWAKVSIFTHIRTSYCFINTSKSGSNIQKHKCWWPIERTFSHKMNLSGKTLAEFLFGDFLLFLSLIEKRVHANALQLNDDITFFSVVNTTYYTSSH